MRTIQAPLFGTEIGGLFPVRPVRRAPLASKKTARTGSLHDGAEEHWFERDVELPFRFVAFDDGQSDVGPHGDDVVVEQDLGRAGHGCLAW